LSRLLAFYVANIFIFRMTNQPPTTAQKHPADLVRIEAEALEQLAQRLEGSQAEVFEQVAALLATTVKSGRRVVLTGIGKSGLIARKIAATLLSTGTSALFLHPTEALHGDLGLLARGDVLLALSYSGESEELLRLLPVFPRLGVALVTLTGCLDSALAKASAHVLDVSVDREACNHQLAPTASTTTMLALGDALAIDVSRRLNFQPQDFAELHPGGQLGKRLIPVHQLMHTGEAIPIVAPTATLPEIIHEMSAKRLGLTTVQANGKLLGILSDGDLRRLFARSGPDAFHLTAAEILNPNPRTIAPIPFAADALALMERHKITALLVTEDGTASTAVQGVLHLHDLLA
jgi:arabinose-5-phosphate isomerase